MKKILLIDDEKDLVFFIKANIELTGKFEVITANDGESGIKSAIDHKPDLILLDIMMPGKDGIKTLSDLKRKESTRNIPIIMLSARGESTFLFEGKRLGAADFIIKPCEIKKLLKYINRHLKIKGS